MTPTPSPTPDAPLENQKGGDASSYPNASHLGQVAYSEAPSSKTTDAPLEAAGLTAACAAYSAAGGYLDESSLEAAIRAYVCRSSPPPPAAEGVLTPEERALIEQHRELADHMAKEERLHGRAPYDGLTLLKIVDRLAALTAAPLQGGKFNPYDITGAIMSDPECYKELTHEMQVMLHRDLTANLGLVRPQPDSAGVRK